MPKHVTESVAATMTVQHDFGSVGLKADLIEESTGAAGVSIDQVLIKDAAVVASGGVTAPVTGNVTGNLTGNVAGSLTGNIASLTGDVTVSADDSHDLGANDKRMANVFTKKISGEPFPGFMQRPKFTYSTTTAIKISAGSYYHCGGTKERLLYWDSELTYTFISLGASDWSYLYLDDGAIDTANTNLIAVGQMTDSTTEPAWSHAKHGWYNNDDLCIGAMRTTAGSVITEFFHDGGDYVAYAADIEAHALGDIDATFTDHDVTLTIPKFATKAQCVFYGAANGDNTAALAYWRTNGQTNASGHLVCYNCDADDDNKWATVLDVITDSSQVIEIRYSQVGDHLMAVTVAGWYFPNGM